MPRRVYLCYTIASTTYSAAPSMTIGAGGAVGVPLYVFRRLTWNTGCTFILSGSSNLKEAGPTYLITRYGPTNLGFNLVLLHAGNYRFLVDNITSVLGFTLDSCRCLSEYLFILAYDSYSYSRTCYQHC